MTDERASRIGGSKLAESLKLLDEQATPGAWTPNPERRLYRHADHYLAAALVNAWRSGEIGVTSSETPPQQSRMSASEGMADAVRGVMQVLRGKPGATFMDVRTHCRLRGDDMTHWPAWALSDNGYVTEDAAAKLIYEIMAVHAPYSESTSRTEVDGLRRAALKNAEDAARWRALKELAGYWQDGSQTTVKLYQDDALRSCFIEAGNKTYGTDGSSFNSAIDAAIAALAERPVSTDGT